MASVNFEATSSDPPRLVNIRQVGAGSLIATYDQPLVGGVILASNWTGELAGVPFATTVAVASGSDVNLVVTPTGTTIPGDFVDYAASPADVISLATGLPAAAFTGEPIIP